MRRWIAHLRNNAPDVLLGANIDASGGVRNHLLGIERFSTSRVELAPPDDLISKMSYTDFHTIFRDIFFDFAPSGIRNIHSHVYPYFVEWCFEHRAAGGHWIHTYHSPYFPTFSGDPLEPWQGAINKALIEVACHAHTRISVSRWQQAWLDAEHGISTTYIPNGIDVEECCKARAARFVEQTGLEDFVLYVGRNDAVKNPADFVRLARQMPERRFVIAGDGLDPAALKYSWSLESPPNVTYLGQLSRNTVQDALAACTALVVTSLWEGLPTLVLEAHVHRTPVVVPDNPGCLEATANGEFGFVYGAHDLNDLIRATRDAIRSERSTRRSKEWILDEFDWRLVAPRLDSLYRE